MATQTARVVIALTAAAMLMQQIMLTRVFSAMVFYHFAFAAVTLTMLGMTLGAVRAFLDDRGGAANLQGTLTQQLTRISVFSVLVAGALLASGLAAGPAVSLPLAVAVVLVFSLVAFIGAGFVIALLLTHYASAASGIYAADLAGAAVGCWLTIVMLDRVGLIVTMTFAAFLPALAAIAIVRSAGSSIPVRTRLALSIAPAALVAALALHWASPQQLALRSMTNRPDYAVEYEAWNSYSRITVGRTELTRLRDQTLSASAVQRAGDVPQKWIVIDSGAATGMMGFDGDLQKVDFLRQDLTAAAYSLRRPRHVGVIGLGGGRDVLIALTHGALRVTGMEVNRSIFDVLTRRYADFAGRLHERAGVTFVNEEARGYINRSGKQFDLIQVSLVDTWAATASGAFALSENGLYTLEGWRDFWRALSNDGMLSFTRWYDPDTHVGELYRMLAMAHALLASQGLDDPARHIAVVAHPQQRLANLVVSKSPVSAEEASAFASRIEAPGEFVVVVLPGRRPAEDIRRLLAGGSPQWAGGLDLSPPTDDRPFFFSMLAVSGLLDDMLGSAAYQKVLNNEGIRNVFRLLAVFTLLSVAVILLPFRRKATVIRRRGASLPFLYFTLIGVGFMIVEISLIQRLSWYLGRPVMALAVVLFGLLLATGLGSAVSGRVKRSQTLTIGAIAVVVGIAALALNPITEWTYSLPEAGRVAIALAVTMLPGFCMGMAFPLGLAECSRQTLDDLVPWFWAANGAASIVGSVAAMTISIFGGIHLAMATGFLCYLAIYFVFRAMRHQPLEARAA
jgi:spermidine synthase